MTSNPATTAAEQEIGCPHGAWGMVVACPDCGSPRTVTPSKYVTDRFLREVEAGEREWPANTAAEPRTTAEALALAMEADGWEFDGDPVFGALSIIHGLEGQGFQIEQKPPNMRGNAPAASPGPVSVGGSDDTAPELAEAAQDRPAEPGLLREAANRLLTECYEVIPPPYEAPGDWDERVMEPSLEACRAMASALAASPPSAPEAGLLDEHRLGLAITAADERIQEEGAGAGLWLHYIAAEYARLTPAPEQAEPDGSASADPTNE